MGREQEDGRWDGELGTFGQNDCSLAYVTAAPLNIPASEYMQVQAEGGKPVVRP